jgi:hypothetical protein
LRRRLSNTETTRARTNHQLAVGFGTSLEVHLGMLNAWRGLAAPLGILLFSSVLALPAARADIIFLNTNGGATEIPAVQAVAQQTGEQVYVIPKNPVADANSYSTPEFYKELLELARRGVRPRAMIVSGHHVRNEGFWGKLGQVSIYYFTRLAPKPNEPDYQQVQEFFGGIQSVYLWGCYTGNLTNVYRLLDGSNDLFRKLKYVVGFGEKGPLNTDPLSGRMLKDVLQKESQLRAGAFEQTLQILTTVPAYQQRDLMIHRGSTYITPAGIMSQADYLKSCSDPIRTQIFNTSIQNVWDYYWNQKAAIPADTSKIDLRTAYVELQRYYFCVEKDQAPDVKNKKNVPTLSMTLRLIYFKNIFRNFLDLYAPYLEFTQKELQKYGIQDVDYLTQMGSLDRPAISQKLESTHALISARFAGDQPQNKALRIYLKTMIADIMEVVYVNETLVPSTWIEPGAKDFTSFDTLGNFEKAKAAAYKAAGL